MLLKKDFFFNKSENSIHMHWTRRDDNAEKLERELLKLQGRIKLEINFCSVCDSSRNSMYTLGPNRLTTNIFREFFEYYRRSLRSTPA